MYTINCEWGLNGIKRFKNRTDAFIIIDVLSFSTSVDIATGKGALIFPYKYRDETCLLYSAQVQAELASIERSKERYSLSPVSLLEIVPETRLVLPSPNGSELSLSTGGIVTLCAGLRNCRAVAEYAMTIGERITVVPAGEKWDDGSIRFALEDYIGAGAVISYLSGELSAESKSAYEMFNKFKGSLYETISGSVSGIELIERGFEEDVALASEFNVSSTVPLLNKNLYRNVN
jgi:2-phosphosulfolactate phosphatase